MEGTSARLPSTEAFHNTPILSLPVKGKLSYAFERVLCSGKNKTLP